MPPSDEMFGWNTFVVKRTLGGLKGSAPIQWVSHADRSGGGVREGGKGARTVGGELNGQEEHSSMIGAALRAHNSGLPLEQVVAFRSCAAIGRGVALQILQLSADAFLGHLKTLCMQFRSVKQILRSSITRAG